MLNLKISIVFVSLFSTYMQLNVSKNTTIFNSTDAFEADDSVPINTRRSDGLLNDLPEESIVTSHKVKTNTYTNHVTILGSTDNVDQKVDGQKSSMVSEPQFQSMAGSRSQSSGQHAWVLSQSDAAMPVKPHVQNIAHSELGWASGHNEDTASWEMPIVKIGFGDRKSDQRKQNNQRNVGRSHELFLGQNKAEIAIYPQIQSVGYGLSQSGSQGRASGQNEAAMVDYPQIQSIHHDFSQSRSRGLIADPSDTTMAANPQIQRTGHGLSQSGTYRWALGHNGATMVLNPQIQPFVYGAAHLNSHRGWISDKNMPNIALKPDLFLRGNSQVSSPRGWIMNQSGPTYKMSMKSQIQENEHISPQTIVKGLGIGQNVADVNLNPQIQNDTQTNNNLRGWTDEYQRLTHTNLNTAFQASPNNIQDTKGSLSGQSKAFESLRPRNEPLSTNEQRWVSGQSEFVMNPGPELVTHSQTNYINSDNSINSLKSKENDEFSTPNGRIPVESSTCMLDQTKPEKTFLDIKQINNVEQYSNSPRSTSQASLEALGISQLIRSPDTDTVTSKIITDQIKNTVVVQAEANLLSPKNDSHQVTISAAKDGIYVNELQGVKLNNNTMVPTDTNSQHNVAAPEMKSQFGRVTVEGYKPDLQYYLRQPESINVIKNPLALVEVPQFLQQINRDPDVNNIHLSEEQLDSYKQYLIRTGLINLKPYQLIFSNEFKPQLGDTQWSVVTLKPNLLVCQSCNKVFRRSILNSTLLPTKLLVPLLRVHKGFQQSVTAASSVAGGPKNMSSGMFDVVKDASSHVNDLLQNQPD